jgi:hypothetical protein
MPGKKVADRSNVPPGLYWYASFGGVESSLYQNTCVKVIAYKNSSLENLFKHFRSLLVKR